MLQQISYTAVLVSYLMNISNTVINAHTSHAQFVACCTTLRSELRKRSWFNRLRNRNMAHAPTAEPINNQPIDPH